ncbi:DUF1492 domain-containing protein [Dielma fastidiosa]|jgi:hypothetical protein|uniref:DUF1492 domain-containing protein n=1 Tax=Dielma fastidiosa TaxID=1034346 RepID=UPI000D7A3BEC|nr:DUF1492 domain-containing protein [Dielma fastidiosa]MBS6168613.1 sigma-70 family RNA polymerase sigma factor [Bacillota bacterium]PWM54027.1 MAG: hypothetical protein DBX92_14495 [Dielma fastidiosa]DAK73401.1 MAG TPA: Protein of unknown function (DUF1492) [Caudoviricetes sp.]
MLTDKDKIEQFKRDCKSNDYYTKTILECNEKIEELDVKLNGLGCPNGNDGPKCENASDPYKSNKLALIMEQDQIIKERNECINKINSVNTKLMKILDPVDRQIIVEVYIDKKNHQHVADKYHMNRQNMYKRINKIIEKIV